MRAQLSMYDWPEAHADTDARWGAMRAQLEAAGLSPPHALDRSLSYEDTWSTQNLFLGQICGLIYVERFSETFAYIGTPDYELPDCKPGFYYSVIVTRKDDGRALHELASAPYAFNQPHSQSGLACLASLDLGKGDGIETGSHRGSVRAVAGGEADYAAIDAITWRLAEAFEPAAKDLQIVAKTGRTPAPVLVTGKGHDPEPFRRALDLAPLTLADYELYR